MNDDIRWIQRFSNYKKAFKQVNSAVKLSQERELSWIDSKKV